MKNGEGLKKPFTRVFQLVSCGSYRFVKGEG